MASIQKISKSNKAKSPASTGIGFISAVTPKTEAILKILEPIRFPKEMAFSFFNAAIIDAASSGILVPSAIILTEITRSLTLNLCAISIAPFTSHSEPSQSEKPPIASQIKILP